MASLLTLSSGEGARRHPTNLPVAIERSRVSPEPSHRSRTGWVMNPDDDSTLTSRQIDERFDLLANDAKEYAVVLIDLDGRLLCWNSGAEHAFGYQSHEIMG